MIKLAVVGSVVEDFYRLLKGTVSTPPVPLLCPHPKNALLPQLPLSPSHPLRNLKGWNPKSLLLQQKESSRQAPGASVSTVTK